MIGVSGRRRQTLKQEGIRAGHHRPSGQNDHKILVKKYQCVRANLHVRTEIRKFSGVCTSKRSHFKQPTYKLKQKMLRKNKKERCSKGLISSAAGR